MCGEQSRSGDENLHSRPACPAIGKQKLAILFVGASRASLYVYLVIVVFAGAFPKTTEFQGVISFYPGKAVRYVIDGTRGVRRIRPPAQSRKVGQIHRWDAVWKQLASRK